MDKITKIKKLLYRTDVGCSVLEDLETFECEFTPERVLEELDHWMFLVKQDGWECHLQNPQQVTSLKTLIKKVTQIIKQ